MGITGRYDFKGIQKAARVAIDAGLAATGWGLWLIKSPLKGIVNIVEDLIVNWLANRGLILLNLGAIYVEGVFDQSAFDRAIDEGIQRVQQGRENISPAEGQKIDDAVRDAFDKFADLGAAGVHNVSDSSVRSGSDTPL